MLYKKKTTTTRNLGNRSLVAPTRNDSQMLGGLRSPTTKDKLELPGLEITAAMNESSDNEEKIKTKTENSEERSVTPNSQGSASDRERARQKVINIERKNK